ncbi:MAG: murein biosynthesis integral membrane protein MurJ, partial [Pseudomonadota bacterium]|nr:murein biosynthesis integral membrane protein MurJ [Pseudomonadota bacterium]
MAFLRSVATVGLFTLLSRLLGFVRDLLMATLLGAGPIADAFVVAQRLPNSFRSIFAEGAMDTAFVPIYTRKRQSEMPESVYDFVNHIFTILLIALLPLVGLALMFMPHIIATLAPGFVGDPVRFHLATTYGNITFGYLILISVTALQGGLLNASGHFGPSASAPAILNATMITGFLVAAYFGLDPGIVGCWTLMAGGIIQLAVLYGSCRRHGFSLRIARPRLTTDLKQFFKLVGPGVLGTGADQFNLLVTTIMASSLPSGVIAGLYYADRLNQLPLGVIGGAVATALLPALTRHIAAREESATIHYFSRALEIALILCLPACLILIIAAVPIVQLLFEHGVFDAKDARVTAEIISGYALTIPSSVLVRIFTVRFFAHENTRMPVLSSLCSIALNTVLAYVLRERWQHFGIALAYALTMCCNATILWAMLYKHGYAKLDPATWRKLPRVVISAAIMGLVLYMTRQPADELASWLGTEGLLHI